MRHDKCRHSGQKTGKWRKRAPSWVMRYSLARFPLISFLFYMIRISHHLHLHNIDLFSFRLTFRFVVYSHLANVIENCLRVRDAISKRMRTRQVNFALHIFFFDLYSPDFFVPGRSPRILR